MMALTKERKKLMKEFPNLVDYESKLAVPALLRRRSRCPSDGAPIDDIVVKQTLLGAVRHKTGRAAVPALERRRRGRSAATCASASPRC